MSQIKNDIKFSADKVSETLKNFGILNLPDSEDEAENIEKDKFVRKKEGSFIAPVINPFVR